MIDADKFKRISQRIDSYREAMIELQIALSAVPAVGPENGGDGEFLKSNLLKERLLLQLVLKISAIMTRGTKEFPPAFVLILLQQ